MTTAIVHFPRVDARQSARLGIVCACIGALMTAWGCHRAAPAAAQPSTASVTQSYSLGANADRPDAAVTLTVDRTTMTVADRVVLTVRLDTSHENTISWAPPPPEPPDGRLGDFLVAAHVERPVAGTAGRVVTEHTLVLEPFLNGKKTIPAIGVQVISTGAGSSVRTIATQPITIEVSSLLTPEEAEKADKASAAEIAPPRDPLAATIRVARGNVAMVAAAGAALATWLGAFAWARLVAGRRRAASDPVAAAMQALGAIRTVLQAAKSDPFSPAAGRTADAAAELASTIRAYLQNRLGVTALGSTASEIAIRLSTVTSIPADLARETGSALLGLEQELFAPTQPRPSVLIERLELAERLVRETSAGASVGELARRAAA